MFTKNSEPNKMDSFLLQSTRNGVAKFITLLPAIMRHEGIILR